MWLDHCAIDRQESKAGRIDETLDECWSIKALKFGSADVISSRRSVEKAIDPSGFCLCRSPGFKLISTEPRTTISQAALHVGKEVEMVSIPDVQKDRGPSFHAYRKGRRWQPQREIESVWYFL